MEAKFPPIGPTTTLSLASPQDSSGLAPPQDVSADLAVHVWKSNKTKVAGQVCDLLYDLYGGNYDEAIQAYDLDEHKDYTSVDWFEVNGMDEYKAVAKALKQRVAAVDISAADAPPPVTARTLKRMHSDADEQAAIKKDRPMSTLWLRRKRLAKPGEDGPNRCKTFIMSEEHSARCRCQSWITSGV